MPTLIYYLTTYKKLKCNAIKNIVVTVQRETNQSCNLMEFMLAFKFRLFLALGDHNKALYFSNLLIKRKRKIGYYYMALNKFLFGYYAECIKLISSIDNYKDIAELVYLKSNALTELNKIEEAWNELEFVANSSKRIKTWAIMADLVQDEKDFERLYENFIKCVKKNLITETHVEIIEHVARGALRAQLYDKAIELWTNYLNLSTKKIVPKKRKYFLSQSMAEIALRQLRDSLLSYDINIFLISGTLLGFYRNNKILSHDKDMDVGVWECVDLKVVRKILLKSGFFYIQPSRSEHVLRVKHVSGVPIDIFKHYRTINDYWHAGVKVSWHNSPFKLKEVAAFGDRYFIPDDENTYLTENYGNWKIPIKKFDSAQDTPNARILNEKEMIIHRLRKMI